MASRRWAKKGREGGKESLLLNPQPPFLKVQPAVGYGDICPLK